MTRLLAFLLLILTSTMAHAQSPDPAFRARAAELVAILDGGGDYDAFFAPPFRQAVPRTTFAPITEQLKAALGEPTGVERTAATSPWDAVLTVGYERGTATMRMVVDPAAPHQVTGLRVTGTGPRGEDSVDRLTADFAALPGRSGFGVYALDDAAPRLLAGSNVDRAAPLGSAFKLWVLAETARQVAAGERRWADVVAVGPPSLPSGMLQSWPPNAPVTLQTLATLMISISDNTATDTLMTTLGRARVDALATATGGIAPVLTTREAFVLKSDPALLKAWIAADRASKSRLLAGKANAPLDAAIFNAGKPIATETVEWFARPAGMAALLDRLRREGGDTARAILAVNPGVDAATAGRFAYVGFKGGSEPGVIALNHLVRDKSERWFAVVGSWHRMDADVSAVQFTGLMNRALALAAK